MSEKLLNLNKIIARFLRLKTSLERALYAVTHEFATFSTFSCAAKKTLGHSEHSGHLGHVGQLGHGLDFGLWSLDFGLWALVLTFNFLLLTGPTCFLQKIVECDQYSP